MRSRCRLLVANNSHGYRQVHVGDTTVGAHRIAYEEEYGPIPEGHVVHHECENKTCVTPEHLTTMTISDHMKYHNPVLEFCRKGHDKSDAYVRPGRSGGECRKCKQERERAHYHANPESKRERERERYHANRAATMVGSEPAAV